MVKTKSVRKTVRYSPYKSPHRRVRHTDTTSSTSSTSSSRSSRHKYASKKTINKGFDELLSASSVIAIGVLSGGQRRAVIRELGPDWETKLKGNWWDPMMLRSGKMVGAGYGDTDGTWCGPAMRSFLMTSMFILICYIGGFSLKVFTAGENLQNLMPTPTSLPEPEIGMWVGAYRKMVSVVTTMTSYIGITGLRTYFVAWLKTFAFKGLDAAMWVVVFGAILDIKNQVAHRFTATHRAIEVMKSCITGLIRNATIVTQMFCLLGEDALSAFGNWRTTSKTVMMRGSAKREQLKKYLWELIQDYSDANKIVVDVSDKVEKVLARIETLNPVSVINMFVDMVLSGQTKMFDAVESYGTRAIETIDSQIQNTRQELAFDAQSRRARHKIRKDAVSEKLRKLKEKMEREKRGKRLFSERKKVGDRRRLQSKRMAEAQATTSESDYDSGSTSSTSGVLEPRVRNMRI